MRHTPRKHAPLKQVCSIFRTTSLVWVHRVASPSVSYPSSVRRQGTTAASSVHMSAPAPAGDGGRRLPPRAAQPGDRAGEVDRTAALRNAAISLAGAVKVDVMVRVRPPPPSPEVGAAPPPPGPPLSVVEPDPAKGTVRVTDAGRALVETFAFDRVFPADATNEGVFDAVAGAVDSVVRGMSCAVLAYGQSGTGKSHSMVGGRGDPGLIPRSGARLLEGLAAVRGGEGRGGGGSA